MKNNLSISYTSIAIMAIAAAGLSASSITPALAQSGLHLVGTTNCQVDPTTFIITCTGEVAGAGTGGTATINAVVTTGCINPGSKDQQPRGLQDTATTGTSALTQEGGRTLFTV